MPYDIFILYALATWGLKLEQSQVAVILIEIIEIDQGCLDMESWELALKAGWEDSKSSRHCSWMQLAKPSRLIPEFRYLDAVCRTEPSTTMHQSGKTVPSAPLAPVLPTRTPRLRQ